MFCRLRPPSPAGSGALASAPRSVRVSCGRRLAEDARGTTLSLLAKHPMMEHSP